MSETNETKNIFRQKSLARLRSPERLDQVVRVVEPKDYLPLGVLGLLIFLGLLWSIVGRIPITVAGQGVLINPRRLVQFQSPISGQLQSLNIREGQCVEKDWVLATIDTSALQQQLQQQRQRLIQLEQQAFQDRILRNQRTRLEQRAIAAQQRRLEQQLHDAQAIAPVFQTQGLAAIDQQKTSLLQQMQSAQELSPILEKRFRNRQQLANVGAISQDVLLQTEQDYRQTVQEITQLKAQLKQLDFQEVETQQRALSNQRTISQIQDQLDELNTKSKQLEQDNLAAIQIREKEIQDAQRAIAQLKKQVVDNGQIKSPQAGCIIEITASVGQVVSPGIRLGTLQMTGGTGEKFESGIVYFAVKDGKQIQPGMKILVTPDTVKREQFGSIVGNVVNISPLPITRERAASVVGNPEVVNQLLSQNSSQIEVVVRLNRDSSTYNGYQWSSSQGPDLKFTPGTTFSARVTVEEQAPISFLLPILREWSGIN